MLKLNTFPLTSSHFNYHFLLQLLFQIRIFSFRQTGLQYPMPSIQRRLFYLYNKMLQVNEFLGKFENQKVIRFSFIQLDHELIFLYQHNFLFSKQLNLNKSNLLTITKSKKTLLSKLSDHRSSHASTIRKRPVRNPLSKLSSAGSAS